MRNRDLPAWARCSCRDMLCPWPTIRAIVVFVAILCFLVIPFLT